jgi:hypothetical protein
MQTPVPRPSSWSSEDRHEPGPSTVREDQELWQEPCKRCGKEPAFPWKAPAHVGLCRPCGERVIGQVVEPSGPNPKWQQTVATLGAVQYDSAAVNSAPQPDETPVGRVSGNNPAVRTATYRHKDFKDSEEVRQVIRRARSILATTEGLPTRQRQVVAYVLERMEELGCNEVVMPLRSIAAGLGGIPLSSVQRAVDALTAEGSWFYKPSHPMMKRTPHKVRRGTKFGNPPTVLRLSGIREVG